MVGRGGKRIICGVYMMHVSGCVVSLRRLPSVGVVDWVAAAAKTEQGDHCLFGSDEAVRCLYELLFLRR